MSFRERLSALIDEHEELLAKHEALIAEKEAWSNFVTSKEDATTLQPPAALTFRSSSGRSKNSSSVFQENPALSQKPNNKKVDEPLSLTGISAQSTEQSNDMNYQDWRLKAAEKTKMLTFRVSGHTAAEGKKQRFFVMKRLGMLDQYKEAGDEEFMTVEVEAHYEEVINDLWVKFNRLDTSNNSTLAAKQLQIYFTQRRGTGTENSLHNLENIASMLKAVNLASGYVESNATDEQLYRMAFPSFVEMMLMEDIDELGSTVVDLVYELRRMFLAGSATAAVALSMRINQSILEDGPLEGNAKNLLEVAVGCVIILNAIIIGMSADVVPTWQGWMGCEIFFTVFFVGELLFKLRMDGFRKHFLGEDIFWNIFDSLLVAFAVVDLGLTSFSQSFNIDLRGITVIRLIRLARLTRVVRLLRLKIFKELLLMVKGIFVGLRTLMWAIMLLIGLIYCIGVLLKQTIGSENWTGWSGCGATASTCSESEQYIEKHRKELFSTVFRSMFTVFRCFMDGCSASDGTPLMVHVQNAFGPLTTIFYVLVVLFVTFGLFNLIMAIFVENTLEAAKYDEARRQQVRRQEYIHGAQQLNELIMEFCHTLPGSGNKTAVLEIEAHVFDKIVSEPRVARMLDDLDINIPNKKDLFEVLDADQSGHIDLRELVQGLMKLRGYASKTDAVATLLSLRALQRSVKVSEIYLMRQLTALRTNVTQISKAVSNIQDTLSSAQVSGHRLFLL